MKFSISFPGGMVRPGSVLPAFLTAGLLICGQLLWPGAAAWAELDEVLTTAGWDEITFDEQPTNRFTLPADAAAWPGLSVDVVSDSSVSVAYKTLDIAFDETPNLAFSWLSQSPDPDTDTSQKGGDDRTLAIYVAFPYQPDEVSFGERVERSLIEVINGKDTPGRVLTYVWGGGAPAGEGFENPYAGKYGHMIILNEPGTPLNVWHDHRIDVRADFIRIFGYEPANPLYVGVGSDSDDTETIIRASVRDIRFVAD
ncbi:MAG: DUF3047 domain-containing protein [Candidatus Puniceispirillales bacterium]